MLQNHSWSAICPYCMTIAQCSRPEFGAGENLHPPNMMTVYDMRRIREFGIDAARVRDNSVR